MFKKKLLTEGIEEKKIIYSNTIIIMNQFQFIKFDRIFWIALEYLNFTKAGLSRAEVRESLKNKSVHKIWSEF